MSYFRSKSYSNRMYFSTNILSYQALQAVENDKKALKKLFLIDIFYLIFFFNNVIIVGNEKIILL